MVANDLIIKFVNISKSFGNICVLKDLSFEIKKGEFIFIVGPSGIGKTTLLRLILREILPDKGQILFDGVDITKLEVKEIPLFRQKIGVVFQDFKVLPERTVRENVEVGLAVKGIPQDEWQEKVNQILKLAGLFERSELFPAQLSGGELQRLSLARALIVNPRLILADEPTGNLDCKTAIEIMQLFEKVNKEGKTIIMATHNQMLVERLKKRVIDLEKTTPNDQKDKFEDNTEITKEKKEKISSVSGLKEKPIMDKKMKIKIEEV